jgi:hypothetical protein
MEVLDELNVDGGKVRNSLYIKALGVVVLMSCLAVSGCKSAPELTQTQALALIQSSYDQATPLGVNILVDDLGMRQGIAGKLWERTKMYPNKYWADFKLTTEGKKAVKLANGGDVIEWRPAGLDDKNYKVLMTTVATNHLKAHDIGELEDEMVAGSATAKGAKFIEGVNLTGVPDTLQEIAHNPGNKLSTKRQADFTLEGGAWKLHSIH